MGEQVIAFKKRLSEISSATASPFHHLYATHFNGVDIHDRSIYRYKGIHFHQDWSGAFVQWLIRSAIVNFYTLVFPHLQAEQPVVRSALHKALLSVDEDEFNRYL